MAGQKPADSGFALVFTIWAIGILALLFSTYIVAARYRSLEVASLTSHAKADAVANAAIRIAIFDMLAGMTSGRVRSRRFPPNGAPVVCTIGSDSRVAIAVVDEGGKIDLNAANEGALRALLRAEMRNRQVADELFDRIVALRSLPESDNAGQDNSGTGGISRIKTIFELEQLVGAGQSTVHALLPLVTVHSGSPGVDATVAPPRVLAALAAEAESSFDRGIRPRQDLPSAFTAVSPERAFSIAATVETLDGTIGFREAIVEFSPDLPNGYKVHEWRDRRFNSARSINGSDNLNPC